LNLARSYFDAYAVGAQSLTTPIERTDGSQLRLLKGLLAGNIIALDLTAFTGQHSDVLAQRLTDLSQNIGIATGDQRFLYPLKELLKNAVFHGNKMDLSLPVYLHYDRASQTIRVIDLARQGEVPKASASLTGRGFGTLYSSKIGTYTRLEMPKDRFECPTGPTVAAFSVKASQTQRSS
jgi:hypothetical protein